MLMSDFTKSEVSYGLFLCFFNGCIVKLKNLPTVKADDMVMMAAVALFVERDAASAFEGFVKQSRLAKGFDVSIDGCRADI